MKRKREESTEEGTLMDFCFVIGMSDRRRDWIRLVSAFSFSTSTRYKIKRWIFFLHVVLPTKASLVENVVIPENSRYQTAYRHFKSL